MNDRVLSLLGLAARGRNLVSGEFSTEKAVKEGRAYLVIVGKDASDNTRKLFTNMCSFYIDIDILRPVFIEPLPVRQLPDRQNL